MGVVTAIYYIQPYNNVMSQKSQPPKSPKSRDCLFNQQGHQEFRFDEAVVQVFPDMINRSVPGYNLIIPMLGLLARRYVQANSRVYDLGCSLGAASLAVSDALKTPGVEIIAVDNSAAMVSKFEQILADCQQDASIQVQLADIEAVEINNASLVMLNFTLQFILPECRGELVGRIFQGMTAGGALLLSEKICVEDTDKQRLLSDWHHDFKRSQGYSDLEIANKRNALENVLLPETMQIHKQRLKEAGFTNIIPWFQCFNFVSLVAVKE